MSGKGTTADFTLLVGKSHYHAILERQASMTPTMNNFLQDAEYPKRLDGQSVLNASVYVTLIWSVGARCGPPCVFAYLSIEDIRVMRCGLFGFLWSNDIAVPTAGESNTTCAAMEKTHFLPKGRLPFIVTVDNNTAVTGDNRVLMDRVEGYQTLSRDQKKQFTLCCPTSTLSWRERRKTIAG